ncbi:hypothetical protein [Kitasatospora sp. P5_F3]
MAADIGSLPIYMRVSGASEVEIGTIELDPDAAGTYTLTIDHIADALEQAAAALRARAEE